MRTQDPFGTLTKRGQKLEDAARTISASNASLRKISRYVVPTRIARVPEHLRCQG